MATAVFYVSGHGYGHATRQSALMRALAARRPGLSLLARTDAPAWLFPEEVRVSAKAVDVGLVQRDALEADLDETERRHLAVAARWDELVDEEARFLSVLGPAFVVCDASPLGCAAAARLGVPAFVVANFLWDWVLEDLAGERPKLRAVAALYRRAYASARAVFRLPLSGGFEGLANVEAAPLLCRRSRLSREQARRALGIPEGERGVLLTFGGVGLSGARAAGGLEGLRFVGWGAAPEGLENAWIRMPDGRAGAHVDAMAACDAALTKPGYGIISESIVHRTRLLYLPRGGFVEIPVLLEGLARHGCGRALAHEDFRAGRWSEALAALLAAPWTGEPLRADGDEFLADRLAAVA